MSVNVIIQLPLSIARQEQVGAAAKRALKDHLPGSAVAVHHPNSTDRDRQASGVQLRLVSQQPGEHSGPQARTLMSIFGISGPPFWEAVQVQPEQPSLLRTMIVASLKRKSPRMVQRFGIDGEGRSITGLMVWTVGSYTSHPHGVVS